MFITCFGELNYEDGGAMTFSWLKDAGLRKRDENPERWGGEFPMIWGKSIRCPRQPKLYPYWQRSPGQSAIPPDLFDSFPPMAARLSYLAATLLAPSVHARAMQGSANSQTWCHSHALYMVYVFLAEKIADDDAKYSCRAGSVFARARMHF